MSRLLAISALLVVVLAGPSGSGGAGARAADEDATDLQALVDGAEPGSELRLPAGTYRGGVVVDKPLRIVGEGWPVVDGQGDGNILEITAPDVTIEGLVLRGSGSSLDRENAGVSSDGSAGIRIVGNRFEDVLFGVFLRRAPDSLVADNVIGAKELSLGRRGDGIRLWESPGTTIEGNTVTDGRDSVLWFSEGLVVRDNVVKRGRYGLHFMYSDDALVEGNWLEGNSVGGFLMYSRNLTLRDNVAFDNRGPSGYGFGFKDMDGIEADGNRLVDNRVGLYFDNSPWSTDVYQHFRRNVVAYNDIGLEFNPSVKRNVFSANAFIDNREQVSLTGGGTFVDNNEWTADGVGNFWSDYAGYDSDGDGLGEVPYRAEDLFGELTDDHPEVAFFSNSPAARAVDMAAQAFPVLRPDPKLVDEAPMVSPPDVPPLARAPAEGSRGLLAVASLAMVGLAAAVVVASGAWPRRRLGLTGVGGVISVEHLTKRYGKAVVVDDVSFEVPAGDAVALWGPNGAGKSTVVRCVLGLAAFEGRVEVGGLDVRSHPKAARRLLGQVPQELSFYEDLSVGETVDLSAGLRRVGAEEADRALELVGLARERTKKVGALSGGMKQRLAIALALVHDPPVILLDEPTSNLDVAARESIVALLEELRGPERCLLLTSHHLEEVAMLVDRVLAMDAGRVTLECEPAELGERLGLRSWLHLVLPREQLRPAVDLLAEHGFEARTNSHGILVAVSAQRKGAALALLQQAGLEILDLEVWR